MVVGPGQELSTAFLDNLVSLDNLPVIGGHTPWLWGDRRGGGGGGGGFAGRMKVPGLPTRAGHHGQLHSAVGTSVWSVSVSQCVIEVLRICSSRRRVSCYSQQR